MATISDDHLENAAAALAAAAAHCGAYLRTEDAVRELANVGCPDARRPGALEALGRAASALGLESRLYVKRSGVRRRLAVTAAREDAAPLPLPGVVIWDRAFAALTDDDAFHALLARGPGDDVQRVPRREFFAHWDGYLLAVAQRSADTARVPSRPVADALGAQRPALVGILGATFLAQCLALATPIVFQVTLDTVLVHRSTLTLHTLMSGLLLAVVFEALLTYAKNRLAVRMSRTAAEQIGTRVFRRFLHLPLACFARGRGTDIAACVGEVDVLRAFLAGPALSGAVDGVFGVLFLVLIWFYSPPLAWFAAAVIGLQLVAVAVAAPILLRRSAAQTAAAAAQHATLTEIAQGVESLKASAAEHAVRRSWADRSAAHGRAAEAAADCVNAVAQMGIFGARILAVGVLWRGADLVMNGHLTVGELVACNILALRLAAPLTRLVGLCREAQRAHHAARRIGNLCALPGEGDRRPPAPPAKGPGRLRLARVSFAYPDRAVAALSDVTLEFPAGESVAVLGAPGSGKTTLARLLCGLHAPYTGTVTLDGVDVRILDVAWLRRRVRLVDESCRLFRGTVRDNIAMGRPGASDAEIVAAARAAGADAFVTRLQAGYATPVDEGGGTLSTGERRLIALARALIDEPPVLIIDASGFWPALVSGSGAGGGLRALAAGRTVLILTEAPAAAEHTDAVVMLEHGRVAAAGRHADLLAAGGRYAALWRAQNHVGLRRRPG